MTQDIAYDSALYNIEAEASLLGAILFDNETLHRITELNADDFYSDIHQRIFSAIKTLVARDDGLADGVTLKEFFHKEKSLTEIGGAIYLMRIMETAAPLTAQARAYADLIADLAKRRSVYRAAQAAQALALNPPEDFDGEDILVEAVRGFDGAERAQANIVSIGQAAERFIAELDAPKAKAIPTGYDLLDRRLAGGLFRGDLDIIAGRPSMGKTAFANNIARNAAKANAKVGMVSAEMSAESIAMRSLAAQSYNAQYGYERFSYTHLRNGAPNINREILRRNARELAQLPLLIDDRAGLTVQQIEWSLRNMTRQLGGLDLVVVDYLQILGRPEIKGKNDAAIIGHMTSALKTMARRLNVAMVVLSQLSRAAEARDDKRPQLNDLRESGAIEQDADVVMGVFREAYYLERREPSETDGHEKLVEWTDRMAQVRDTLEIITLKQRNGPVGTDKLKALVQHDLVLNVAV